VPTLARILMEKEALHPEGESFPARFNRCATRVRLLPGGYGRTARAVLQHARWADQRGAGAALHGVLAVRGRLDFFPAVDAGR